MVVSVLWDFGSFYPKTSRRHWCCLLRQRQSGLTSELLYCCSGPASRHTTLWTRRRCGRLAIVSGPSRNKESEHHLPTHLPPEDQPSLTVCSFVGFGRSQTHRAHDENPHCSRASKNTAQRLRRTRWVSRLESFQSATTASRETLLAHLFRCSRMEVCSQASRVIELTLRLR